MFAVAAALARQAAAELNRKQPCDAQLARHELSGGVELEARSVVLAKRTHRVGERGGLILANEPTDLATEG